MKQIFINKNSYEKLCVFFAGWGVNEQLISNYLVSGFDLMMCFDYRNFNFDFSEFEKYRDIKIVAWSLGVWVAAKTLYLQKNKFSKSIAFNGTMFPIDNEKGISNCIYEGTLANLNKNNLNKFNLRMCGNVSNLTEFSALNAQRSIDDLKEELVAIRNEYLKNKKISFYWDEAIIGKNDKIFPINSQKNAWGNTKIFNTDSYHYDKDILKKIICKIDE